MQMKISIITDTRNSAKTVADTLASVRMQTYQDFEHLIIDGASIDSTLEIVNKYPLNKIRIFSEPDKGIYDAMNKGIALAYGDVIGFLNSDDFYTDNLVLEKIVNVFQDPNVDICYADLAYVTQDKKRIVRYWKSKPFIRGDFAKGWCPAHPTFYVRKSAIKRFGLFDQSYKLAADVELMMRYLEVKQLCAVYVPHILVHMRLGGATNKNWKNISLQNKEVFLALKKNGIPFSKIVFIINKAINRYLQFFEGYLMRI